MLDSQEPFAVGSNRECYIHPEDDSKCIKIIRKPYFYSRRSKFAAARKWLRMQIYRLIPYFNNNYTEYRFYKKYRPLTEKYYYFPKSYGFVETNKGRGLVIELIRDYNGKISQDLRKKSTQKLIDGVYKQPYIVAVDEMVNTIRGYKIPFFDIAKCNFVVQLTDKDKLHLVAVDGFGGYKTAKKEKLEKTLLSK